MSFALSQDRDYDGFPDAWQVTYGSDPDTANADSDFDRDRVTLPEEYAYGSSPSGSLRVKR